MNKITATGRVVADADVRFTNSGKAICSFRLASDVGFGENKTTNWFQCQIWDKRGEALAPHLTKGQQVTVFGALTMREWQNKDGIKQLSPDIRIDEIELQGSKNATAEAPRQQASAKPAPKSDFSDMQDDVPF